MRNTRYLAHTFAIIVLLAGRPLRLAEKPKKPKKNSLITDKNSMEADFFHQNWQI